MSSARASTSCSAASRLRALAPLLLLLLVGAAAPGAQPALHLRPAGPARVEARARQTLSVVLFAENTGAEATEVILEALLPEGFRELTTSGPFPLEGGAVEGRLVGVLVSPRARAGSYPLVFRLRSTVAPAEAALCELQVVVLPEPGLAIRLLECPAIVAAGDGFQALFSLANSGNTDLWVELRVQSRPQLPVRLRGIQDPSRLLLPVGDHVPVTVEVDTPAGLREDVRASLTLLAQPVSVPELEPATAVGRVEIIPVFAGSTRRLRTLGGYAETTAALDNGADGYLQSSLDLNGALDSRGRHKLAVDIRKRLGTDDDTLANPLDRYSLSYSNPVAQLLLGDHSYSLSPLLAANELGRGFQAGAAVGPFGLKALYFQGNGSQSGKGDLGFTGDFTLPGGEDPDRSPYRAGLSVLSSPDGRVAYGLWQRLEPSESMSLQVDAALQSDGAGDIHPALYAEAAGDPGAVSYRTRFVRAWTGFDANYADTQSFLLTGGVRLLAEALALRGTYQVSDNNLELDPGLPTAEHKRTVRLGSSLAAGGWGAHLDLDWENNLQADRLKPAEHGSVENRVRLVWKQELSDSLDVRLDSSLGRTRYTVTDTAALSQRHAIGLDYAPSAVLRADASVSFAAERADYGAGWYTAGWSAGAYREWQNTRLDGRVLNRFYFDDAGLASLNGTLQASIARSLPRGQQLSASASIALWPGAQGNATPDMRLTLRYGAPLNVPVGRQPEVAVVRGRVYREETGEPVRGLVMRLNGLAVATDAKGQYAFHLPHAGRLYLQMERGKMPPDLIPNRPVPIQVDAPSGESRLDVGLVRAAELSGTVVRYGLPEQLSPFAVDPGASEELRAVRLGGLGSVLVELSDGSERRRRLTDPSGDFRFPELRPGRYTLTVAPESLPEHHSVDRAVWELDIAPGQHEHLEIRAAQQQRRLRLVQTDLPVVFEAPAPTVGPAAAAPAPAVRVKAAGMAEAPGAAAGTAVAVKALAAPAATAASVEAPTVSAEARTAAATAVAPETTRPDAADRREERQALLDSLRRSIERSLGEAERLGAALSAPDSWRLANTLYLQGVEALQRQDLDRARERLGAARDAALELLEFVRARREEERLRAQRLMLQVMGELEDASELTVVTEGGTLIPPEPWSGRPYLGGEVRR